MTDIKFVTACHCCSLCSGSPSTWELVSTSEMSRQINQISLAHREEPSTILNALFCWFYAAATNELWSFTSSPQNATSGWFIWRKQSFLEHFRGSLFKSFQGLKQYRMIHIYIPVPTFQKKKQNSDCLFVSPFHFWYAPVSNFLWFSVLCTKLTHPQPHVVRSPLQITK